MEIPNPTAAEGALPPRSYATPCASGGWLVQEAADEPVGVVDATAARLTASEEHHLSQIDDILTHE